MLLIQQLAVDEGPRLKVASPVQRREKAVSLPPDDILSLQIHSNAVDQVEMREGDHCDRAVVLDDREPVTELAIVDYIADASDGLQEFVLLDLALEKLVDVVDVEAS